MHYLALATDYDGTIADEGGVDTLALAALERLRGTDRRLILQQVMPRLDLFDLMVAENRALLYDPANHKVQALGNAPPPAFVERLRELGVAPLWLGQVIVATRQPNAGKVASAIGALGLDLQITLNKGAVMALPASVTKASRLARCTGGTRSVTALLHRDRRRRERPCLPGRLRAACRGRDHDSGQGNAPHSLPQERGSLASPRLLSNFSRGTLPSSTPPRTKDEWH
jgi:hypothetical protein